MRNYVKPRFGAIGKHGSIAVLERFHRTLKDDGLRVIMVPLALPRMQATWMRTQFGTTRTHSTLKGATPLEVRDRHPPAPKRGGIETRPGYPPKARPGGSPKARRIKGDLRVLVRHTDGLPHLPILRIRQAA